jgi:Flp pilus assembly protein TadG
MTPMDRSRRSLALFRHDRRGNIAVIFTIALLPLMIAIGCEVDYSIATRMRAKLQASADAASVAALAAKSPGFIAASAMTTDGSVTIVVTDALKVFNGNLSGVTGYTNLTSSAVVTKTGSNPTSRVQFSAQVAAPSPAISPGRAPAPTRCRDTAPAAIAWAIRCHAPPAIRATPQ